MTSKAKFIAILVIVSPLRGFRHLGGDYDHHYQDEQQQQGEKHISSFQDCSCCGVHPLIKRTLLGLSTCLTSPRRRNKEKEEAPFDAPSYEKIIDYISLCPLHLIGSVQTTAHRANQTRTRREIRLTYEVSLDLCQGTVFTFSTPSAYSRLGRFENHLEILPKRSRST